MGKVRISGRLIALLLLAVCLSLPQTVLAKESRLSFSAAHGPTAVHTRVTEAWIAELEDMVGDKVKVDLYPGQSLIKLPQTFDGVENGMVSIGHSVLQYTRGRFPVMDFINLPLGYPSGPVATAIINEVVDKFDPQELKSVKLLYVHATGPGYIHVKGRSVAKMEDLQGLKIRSNGPIAEMLKALGATPVSLPMPELYQALQKGVVHGGVWDFSASVDWKLAEVADMTIVAKDTAYSLGFFVAMNKGTWNGLDPEVQQAIDSLRLKYIKKHGQAWADYDQGGIEFEKKLGNTIVEIDAAESKRWRAKVQPIVDAYIADCEAKGLPGKEVIAYVEQRIKDAEEGHFVSQYLD